MANEKKSKTVKIKILRGRMLIGHNADNSPSRYAEEGDVVEADRRWAEALVARAYEGYPQPASGVYSGQPGAHPGTIFDSPIQILGE